MMPTSMANGMLIPLAESSGTHLESWQIAFVAFGVVAWVLLVATVLERWEGRLHA